VEGRLREGAVRILRVVLLASRGMDIQRGGRQWSPPIRTRTPVSVVDPSIPNDVGARPLLATSTPSKERRHLARFQFGPPTVQGTHSHGSISRFYGPGLEHFGLPLVRRPTGETFT
jgi:hypothetical protein